MLRVLLTIAILWFSSLCFAESLPKVVWYISDFYPCHIIKGQSKNLGYCDQSVREAIDLLPEYQHELEVVTTQRALAKMKNGTFACSIQFFPTDERKAFMLFTEPVSNVLPNGAIIASGDDRFDAHFDANGRLSLSSVLSNDEFIIGLEKGRSYGQVIDKLLMTNTNPAIYSETGIDYQRLLDKRRVDLVLGYPYEKFGSDVEAIADGVKKRFLPLSEDAELYNVHFSCTKSEIGKQVIKQLNERVVQLKSIHTNYYRHWLHPSVLGYYNALLRKR